MPAPAQVRPGDLTLGHPFPAPFSLWLTELFHNQVRSQGKGIAFCLLPSQLLAPSSPQPFLPGLVADPRSTPQPFPVSPAAIPLSPPSPSKSLPASLSLVPPPSPPVRISPDHSVQAASRGFDLGGVREGL